MISTHVNPPWLGPNDYVEFLNRCFPGTWNQESFHWYLRRCFGGQATDIAVRSDGTRLLAMVAVCYRRVLAPDGQDIKVGIMLAGGTAPFEQRRGHYSALMQASLDIGRERGCEALLGFVTRQNGSGRGLSRLGAYSVPSFYITSRTARRPRRAVRWSAAARRFKASALGHPALLAQAAQMAQVAQGARKLRHVSIRYEDPADWVQQFLRRSHPVRICRPTHDSAALLESVGNTDRLQWLHCPEHRTIATIASLAEASARADRDFFMYTMDPLLARATQRIGLKVRDGFLKILPVHRSAADSVKHLSMQPWRLQSGDRM